MYNTSHNITFIFTSRTSIYKTRYEPFEFENMSVYDLNLLDENEIEDLIRIFNHYGYYPIKEMKDFTKYIRENCSSKLQAVILDIFDNSDIEKSLLQTTENLNQKDNYAKVIKFLVIVKVMSLELDFEDILNLTRIRTIDYNFEKNSYNADTIKEIKKINALLTPTGAEADDEYYCYKMSASYYPKLFEKFYTFMTDAEKEEMKKIATQNYNLCKAYINKNKNVSFRTKATDFANTFLKYSVFSLEGETYDFHVERITKYFAYGTLKINETTEEAKIHISKISKSFVHNIFDYLKINQTVKVKTVKYDKDKNIWEVSMI